MKELHNTTIAVFGGRPGQSIEFKGNIGITFPSAFQLKCDHRDGWESGVGVE